MNLKTTVKAAKIAVTSKTGRSVLKVQKQSPHILFVVGVVGVVGTAVLASKATLKFDEILDENADKRQAMSDKLAVGNELVYSATDYTKDLGVLKAKLVRDTVIVYAPAVVCGVVTIGSFTGSHVILNRRYQGVVAAYAAVSKAFEQYQEKVVALIGPEKERELRYDMVDREIAVDGENGTEIKTIQEVNGISQYGKLFSQQTSTEWVKEPDYRLVLLRSQQAWANDRLQARGFLILNEVYHDLGLEETTAGAVVGWVYDNPNGGDNYVDFGIFTDRQANQFREFMTQKDGALWLDFNVDGIVYDLLDKKKKRTLNG